jgi:hypothetical protein
MYNPPFSWSGHFLILPDLDIAYRPIGPGYTWGIVSTSKAFTVTVDEMEQVVEHHEVWTCIFQTERQTKVRVCRDGVLIAEVIPMEER